MTVTYSAETVIDTLYQSILGRQPDPDARTAQLRKLEESPVALRGILDDLMRSPERLGTNFSAHEIMNALFIAALGRLPDPDGRVAYSKWVEADPTIRAIERIGAALFNSAEHQDRLLPGGMADRVLLDHSPSGEFPALLRYLIGESHGRGLIVEVGLSSPDMSLSLDLLKVASWRGLLIEPSLEIRASLESRFSGTDFDLIPAKVLETKDPALVDPSIRMGTRLGLVTAPNAKAPLIPLASVLAKAGVPKVFNILAVSNASNTAAVVNDLVVGNEFQPTLLIVTMGAPSQWTDFPQMGLAQEVAHAYQVVFSSQTSVFLRRR